ncbi:MAG: aminotransferase class V-fold PLP-dependent enzyme, partial [Nitrospirota bacterium]|nr:aminotransferase class V-fold PLP-dependent enzyme [Nitrospirota bacterium]
MSSTPQRIYVDNAATTPVRAEVLQEMLPFFSEHFGNPSSLHFFGRKTKAGLEEARERVANAIGAKKEEIVFTSGGTEADNLAIKGTAWAKQNKGNHIITSSIEHHAVLETCHYLEKNGFDVTYLPVDSTGLVNPDDVRAAITDKTILISIMHGNNEIGTVQPIAEIGAIAKEKGITFHTDAVQTVGNIPVNVDDLNCNLLAISAHKIYGPKGVGALYVRKGTRLVSLFHGGEQERRRRAGTENLASIVGFGKAIDMAVAEMPERMQRLTALRDKLINGVLTKVPYTRLNGHPEKRLPVIATSS